MAGEVEKTLNPFQIIMNFLQGASDKAKIQETSKAMQPYFDEEEKARQKEVNIKSQALDYVLESMKNGKDVSQEAFNQNIGKPKPEYDYPGGWENPQAGVGVTGQQGQIYGPNQSSRNITGYTPSTGGSGQSTNLQIGQGANAQSSSYTKFITPTPHGDYTGSQLNMPGHANYQQTRPAGLIPGDPGGTVNMPQSVLGMPYGQAEPWKPGSLIQRIFGNKSAGG